MDLFLLTGSSVYHVSFWILKMAAAKIVSALAGSFAIAYVCDYLIADSKIFGGKLLSFTLIYFLVLILSFFCIISVNFYQVKLQILFQARNGGKKLTKSFRLGLALLVPRWSWTPSVAKILLSRTALTSEAPQTGLAVFFLPPNFITLKEQIVCMDLNAERVTLDYSRLMPVSFIVFECLVTMQLDISNKCQSKTVICWLWC